MVLDVLMFGLEKILFNRDRVDQAFTPTSNQYFGLVNFCGGCSSLLGNLVYT